MPGLVYGTAYQFRVVARNSVGDSGVSNVVTATPMLPVSWVDLVGVTANSNSITKDGGHRLDEMAGRPRPSGSLQTAGWNSTLARPIWMSSAGCRRITRM